MMEMRELSKIGFIKEFKRVTSGMHPRKFCFVLGAGASISSGIRSGQQLVAGWDAELKERFSASDYEAWKNNKGITADNQAEHYSDYYEEMFPIPMDGYAYLETEMENASPGAGYAALAYILCKKETDCNVVLTTNFDHLVEDAVNHIAHVFPLVIGHEALAHYIVDDAKRPIIIKIHRDLLMDPKSRGTDIDHLEEKWKEHLPTIFENYYPIFVGYAGNDKSLMDYLLEKSENFNSGKWKLPYWTLFGKNKISGKAKKFMQAAGGYVIQDCDFDEIMIRLGDALGYRIPAIEETLKEAEREHNRIKEKTDEVLRPSIPFVDEPERIGLFKGNKNDETNEEEVESLNEAIERITGDTDYDSPSARLRQVSVAIARKDFLNAEEIVRGLIQEEPENALYYNRLGEVLHDTERYDEAVIEKKKAVKLLPENAMFHFSLSRSFLSLLKYDDALDELKKAVKYAPENPWYHLVLGDTYHDLKQYSEALVEKKVAVALEPGEALFHISLGDTLQEMGHVEEAIDEKKKAVELKPEDAYYHGSLGDTLLRNNLFDEAVAETKKAIELKPGDAFHHECLGDILHEMGQFDEAAAEKKIAVQLAPEDAFCHYSLGVSFHEKGLYDEAEAEKRIAVQLVPEDAFYHNSLGDTLFKMEKYSEAEVEYRMAVQLEPEEASYHFDLAKTYRKMGKKSEALLEETEAQRLEKTIINP